MFACSRVSASFDLFFLCPSSDARLCFICLHAPAASLHFSPPACICTTCCSAQSRGMCARVSLCVCDIQFTAFTTNCSKKMRRSLYPAVGAVPTCCNCGLCKHSTLITIRELSLNSLAPWLVWRAKICIQSKALECIRVILLRRALRREQCLSKNRALSV